MVLVKRKYFLKLTNPIFYVGEVKSLVSHQIFKFYIFYNFCWKSSFFQHFWANLNIFIKIYHFPTIYNKNQVTFIKNDDFYVYNKKTSPKSEKNKPILEQFSRTLLNIFLTKMDFSGFYWPFISMGKIWFCWNMKRVTQENCSNNICTFFIIGPVPPAILLFGPYLQNR